LLHLSFVYVVVELWTVNLVIIGIGNQEL
jgi:hypothetical protein